MNIPFYKKLLAFRSHSKGEVQIQFRDWLEALILSKYNKNKDIKTHKDEYGNLYVEKGTATTLNCVIAHLDINQRTITSNFEILHKGDWILGIDLNTGYQVGLGHDDKTGVYFALKALEEFDNIKIFFPLDEEIGLVGTRNCDPTFFENVGFMVQLDRRGNSDISSYTNGNEVVTTETQTEFADILATYGYKFARCVSTDVGYLVGVLEVQGVNISCGYYNEHSDKEVLNVNDYDNAELFALEVLKQTDSKVYPIKQKPPTIYPKSTTSYGSGYGGYGGYNGYDDYGDYSPNKLGTWGGKKSTTNARVGKQMALPQSNANSHSGKTIESKTIDTHQGDSKFVKSSDINFDYSDFGFEPPIEEITSGIGNDFQFKWHSSDTDEIALYKTEELIAGYKNIIQYVLRESKLSDQEAIDMFETLTIEIKEVEEIGEHDLSDIHSILTLTILQLKEFIEQRRLGNNK